MFVKNMKLPALLDTYGALITKRQYDVLDLYYNEDLSLSEISEITGISRQGVRDSVKKGEGELVRFEEALGLVGKRDRAERLFREGEQIGDGEAKRIITELSEIYS
ncbi:MAG: DNA-binding protein [Clostridia bacterium]|nr:DNA-binding protein [Clostridia bacterium]